MAAEPPGFAVGEETRRRKQVHAASALGAVKSGRAIDAGACVTLRGGGGAAASPSRRLPSGTCAGSASQTPLSGWSLRVWLHKVTSASAVDSSPVGRGCSQKPSLFDSAPWTRLLPTVGGAIGLVALPVLSSPKGELQLVGVLAVLNHSAPPPCLFLRPRPLFTFF